ncbi:hypothetical protein ATE84_5017 [Aquimarina sp. MAR_2010_214]|uniref:hypothetical protein n=1 Tax=Aquimarina sp. MAR_2010_214 TaxID=1250026 RepID=UPI000C702C03|nr:hypothetical protein [Aquimarina sp. MAR_2010_214]PKV52886.1 hypothetical protein ATE84_5017 [Aquimarina sp. MAR_2010_214]
MTTQMHLAAQYLAAAGISFLKKKNDDSHTNLGFSIEKGTLYTRPLNPSRDILSLNYNLFALEWNSHNSTKTLQLDGTSHAEVLQWIRCMAKDSDINTPYNYALHYELPYTITDDYIYTLKDPDRLRELVAFRKLSKSAIQEFLQNNLLNSEIRIWPHHFDTGAFASLEDESGLAIGLGLAIPDTMCNDYYFYISGYQSHDSLDTSDFKPLTTGKWYNEGFKGAVLPISGVNKTTIIAFFEEAFTAYKN